MYKKISDYGIIGDLRTVALIGLDGSLDWLCFPHIDSPSVFGALLDHEKGGFFALRPVGDHDTAAEYLPSTNILVTRFRTRAGEARLTDFMALPPPPPDSPPDGPTAREADPEAAAMRLYRLLDVTRGEMEFEAIFAPRFDYARTMPEYAGIPDGFAARGGGVEIALTASGPLEVSGHDVVGRFRLRAGQSLWFRLASYAGGETVSEPCPLAGQGCPKLDRVRREQRQTEEYWRSWLARSETGRTFDAGPYTAMVERSALVLKLLYYSPTGTIAAAATTSLPEEIGGERNWDYRYTWIRDASFTLAALYNTGHLSELEGYLRFIEAIISERGADNLRIMYGLRGEDSLPETELGHLDGYKGSRPVRVGNAAIKQTQHDIYGELMDSALKLSDYVGRVDEGLWPALRAIVDHVADNWRSKDSGIWEMRGGPRDFLHSRLMCWVALDRGAAIARRYGFSADLEGWQKSAGEIRREILTRGFDPARESFVQCYGSDALDASALLIPIFGFLPFDDERVASTITAIEETLVRDGFVYRYLSDDGLSGEEGVFLLCTFWYIDCLIGQGRIEEAGTALARVTAACNHLGLFAEEYDLAWQEPLGNFPQAFTHIGYINSVTNLMRAKADGQAGRDAPKVSDKALDFIRKKILAPNLVLNKGPAQEAISTEASSPNLAARLKAMMNTLRGAFFDNDKGRVSYELMKRSHIYEEYKELARCLSLFDPASLASADERKAFWINLYNVIVIHGVIELDIRDSVREVRNFFSRIRYVIGGIDYSPDDIEHTILRAGAKPPSSLFRGHGAGDPRLDHALESLDPRIHFALVCASSSCPPIGVYTAGELDRELDTAARAFINGGGVRVDTARGEVELSRIMLWYGKDFGKREEDRLAFVSDYLYDQNGAKALREDPGRFTVRYQDYDWRLNRG